MDDEPKKHVSWTLLGIALAIISFALGFVSQGTSEFCNLLDKHEEQFKSKQAGFERGLDAPIIHSTSK
jgi:hypothetical protein